MSRISRPSREDLSPEARRRWDDEDAAHGMTHMKQTLLRSLPAFDALMTWYPLRDALIPFVGERGTIIVSHAISTTNECLICSLYFRRALAQRGEDLSAHPLTDEERDLEAFGRQVAAGGSAEDAVMDRLRGRLGEEGLVLLVAFAGIMVATNIANEALDVDPDEGALELFTGPSDEFSGFRAARVRSLRALGHDAAAATGLTGATGATGSTGATETMETTGTTAPTNQEDTDD